MSAEKLLPPCEVIEDCGKLYSVMRAGGAEVRAELPEGMESWPEEQQEAYFDELIPEQQKSLERQIAVIAEIKAENAAAARIAKAEEKREKRAAKRKAASGLKIVKGEK